MQQALSVHRQILKEAWEITWRFKPLWLLGAFASFWATQNIAEAFFNPPLFSPSSIGGQPMWWQIPSVGGGISAASLFGLVIGVAIFGFIVWITTASRGGLISAVDAASRGKTTSLSQAWTNGTQRFWSIFGISIAGKIIWGSLIFGITCLAAYVAPRDSVAQSILFSALFILMVIVALSLTFIINYALSLVMLHGIKPLDAAVAGTKIFYKNWLLSLEMAVILYGVGILVGITFVAILFVLLMPFMLLWMITASLGHMLWFFIFATPAAILIVAAGITMGAAFTTFQFAAWVLLFKRLMSGNALAKLIRVFHHPR
ncbi:MAG: hypothetical protein AAB444_00085 [Patescibacteria group bacterium]